MAIFLSNLDDWLVLRLEEIAGVGTVVVGDTVNPSDLCPMGGVVRTLNGRLRAGEHGDGAFHHEISYPVWLGVWATDSDGIAAAKKQALELIPSLFAIIHDEDLYDLTGESITGNGHTEIVKDVATPGTFEIFLRDGGASVGGIAVAVVNLTVTTGV